MSVFGRVGVGGVEPCSWFPCHWKACCKHSLGVRSFRKGLSLDKLLQRIFLKSLGNSISLVVLIPLAGENPFSALQEREAETLGS